MNNWIKNTMVEGRKGGQRRGVAKERSYLTGISLNLLFRILLMIKVFLFHLNFTIKV